MERDVMSMDIGQHQPDLFFIHNVALQPSNVSKYKFVCCIK